jgi:hypothetical protein
MVPSGLSEGGAACAPTLTLNDFLLNELLLLRFIRCDFHHEVPYRSAQKEKVATRATNVIWWQKQTHHMNTIQ